MLLNWYIVLCLAGGFVGLIRGKWWTPVLFVGAAIGFMITGR